MEGLIFHILAALRDKHGTTPGPAGQISIQPMLCSLQRYASLCCRNQIKKNKNKNKKQQHRRQLK